MGDRIARGASEPSCAVLNVQRALKSDRLLRALTELNRKAFEELKSTFAEVLASADVPRRSPFPR